jgi:hypothetical protein
MFGGNDGYVRKWNQADRTYDGTGIAFKVTTPTLSYGSPWVLKTLMAASLGLQPKNDTAVTFGWTRDNRVQQTQTVTQGGGALLDSFVLGTDVLGGGRFVDRFLQLEEGGEFRSVEYEISHSINNQHIELHSFTTQIMVGAISTEN